MKDTEREDRELESLTRNLAAWTESALSRVDTASTVAEISAVEARVKQALPRVLAFHAEIPGGTEARRASRGSVVAAKKVLETLRTLHFASTAAEVEFMAEMLRHTSGRKTGVAARKRIKTLMKGPRGMKPMGDPHLDKIRQVALWRAENAVKNSD